MELTEKTLLKKEIYDGKIVHLHVDEVELPDGRKSVREVVDHVDGVCIAAENEQGEKGGQQVNVILGGAETAGNQGAFEEEQTQRHRKAPQP